MTTEVTVLLGDPTLPDRTKVDHIYSREDLEAVERMKAALVELTAYSFRYLNAHGRLLEELVASPPSLVLNLCDTGFRNDPAREPHLPALLELLGVPYTGAGPACMALCYDKGLVRAAAEALGVRVPLERYVDVVDALDSVRIDFPLLIKPCRGDGSVGITQHAVVQDREQARRYLSWLLAEWPGRGALVQEFLPGAEYGLGLIGNPGLGFHALPPMQVDYSGLDPGLPPILSYESKTVPDSPYWSQIRYRRAELPEPERRRLVREAEALFERLGLRDYARFDFRADAKGEIKLLEVNHNPAWCWDGKLNFMAEFEGLRYAQLFERILEAARARIEGERERGS